MLGYHRPCVFLADARRRIALLGRLFVRDKRFACARVLCELRARVEFALANPLGQKIRGLVGVVDLEDRRLAFLDARRCTLR